MCRSVQRKFPVYLTWKYAIDLSVVNWVVLSILNKMSFSAMARVINFATYSAYYAAEFAYLVTIFDLNARRAVASLFGAVAQQKFVSQDFGSFEDWGGFVVSAAFLQMIFIEDASRIDDG